MSLCRLVKLDTLKKLLLSATAFLLYALVMANYIHAASLFLTFLGPEKLPYALVASASFILLFSFLSSVISIRFASHQMFFGMMAFIFLNFLVLTFVTTGTAVHVFYFMILSLILANVQEILMLNFANSMLTPLQAKSFLPTVISYMSIGAITGAFFALPYQEIHEALGIGYLPMTGLLILMLLIIVTSRFFKKEIYANFSPQSLKTYKQDFKSSLKLIFDSTNLYKLVGVIVILAAGIHVMMEFKLKTVLSMNFGHVELTEVLSLIYMINRIAVLVMTTFFAKKLLFRFGVTNMLITYPVMLFSALGLAVVFQLNVYAVILAYIVYNIFQLAFFGISTTQILSVIPKKNQQSVFYLIRGILTAAATVVFSLILLIYSYNISLESTLNTGMTMAACVLLFYAGIKTKEKYEITLKENLFKEDEYLKLKSIDLLAEKVSKDRGEKDLRRLLNIPTISQDVRSRVMASIGIIGNYQTIMDLTKVLLSTESSKVKVEAIHAIDNIIRKQKDFNRFPVTKHYLLQAYEKILLSDQPQYVKMEVIDDLKYFDLEDVIDFLEKNLQSESTNIRANTIKTLASFNDRGIIPFIEPFLGARDLQIRASAIVSLWKYEEMRPILTAKIARLLTLKSEEAVQNSLYVIGSIDAQWDKDYVLRQMDHDNPHIRTFALLTLIQLGETTRLDDLVKKMLMLVKEDDHTEIEFILSHYRYFEEGVKKTLIRKIQQMKENEAQYFYNAFRDSRYVFNWEESQLSKGADPGLKL